MIYLKIYMVLIAIILLFGLQQSIFVLIDHDSTLYKIIAFIVFVAIIYVGFQRNTYLPFLGPSVFPHSLLKDPKDFKKGSLVTTLQLDVPDNTKVVYWASQPSKTVIEDPFKAYRDYSNAGIAVVKNKKAELYVNCPSSYKIPTGRILKPHVHYRAIYPNGMAGSVETLFIKC